MASPSDLTHCIPETVTAAERMQLSTLFMQKTIYFMGISFVLGSFCTIFILLILDMVRKSRDEALHAETDLEEPIDYKDQ